MAQGDRMVTFDTRIIEWGKPLHMRENERAVSAIPMAGSGKVAYYIVIEITNTAS